MLRLSLILLFVLGTSTLAHAKVVEKLIDYKDGDAVLQGYLVYDNANTNARPGVLVVHEWWGLNDYAKKRARQLAELGYVAFAADIYGKGIGATTADKAKKLSGPFYANPEMFRKRVLAGLGVLKSQALVKDQNLAAIGYCFGGTAVLELARSGTEIAGVASFHGGLSSAKPATKGSVKTRLLVLTGADDPYVPPQQVADFQKEMSIDPIDYQIVSYSGAVHAFTNPAAGNDPSKGVAYNAVAARRSWVMMKTFLVEILMK